MLKMLEIDNYNFSSQLLFLIKVLVELDTVFTPHILSYP